MNAVDYFFENTKDLSKLFVLGSKETISYNDLYRNSIKLASWLYRNIGKEQNVLLLVHNSVFFIIAYLAIIKSGNIVVPLNPEIEQANFDYIQNNCQSVLYILSGTIKKLRIDSTRYINEDDLQKIIDQEKYPIQTFDPVENNQLAEIIYTSGSTGEPKGVMISHRNLIANTESIVSYLKLSQKDIMLVVLPFYYCYGLSLLHTHLRVGGSIVLNNMFIMIGGVIKDLKQFKCTGFAGVPAHFQILLRKSDSFKTTIFTDLKYVTQAGGKLHNAFIKEFVETFPEIKFNVMYGQTEATARLSWLPTENLYNKIGSCGKAIPGVIIKIINEKGVEIKPGEIGEICAFGENIMLGYYKDPESTKKTIKNGWLHTGDLATIDDEGFIFLTARKKEIIKVGGRRISPKEIEDVIVGIPDVIDCSIEGAYDEILGEAIKAIIVVKGSSTNEITSASIKRYCGERLVSYKIPQVIDLKSEINISPTGKKIKKS